MTADEAMVIVTSVYVVLTGVYVGISVAAFRTLRQQGKTGERAAAAAKESADATTKNVEMIANIERPWVLASMEQEMRGEVIASRTIYLARCIIKNFGKTPAWITRWGVITKDIKIEEPLPLEPNYSAAPNDSIPEVLPPGESRSSLCAWLPERLSQAHEDKILLFVFGFVLYKDGFGRDHETRFCFRYYPPFRDNKAQGFHVGGPPAYNCQT
jgi:hypothetical protein